MCVLRFGGGRRLESLLCEVGSFDDEVSIECVVFEIGCIDGNGENAGCELKDIQVYIQRPFFDGMKDVAICLTLFSRTIKNS